MPKELARQMEALIEQIDACDGDEKTQLAAELEDIATRLDAMGQEVPEAIRLKARESLDDAVEDRFDNMPV